MSCAALERAVRLENFVERFRADAVKRFHRAQDLAARHQHPFRSAVFRSCAASWRPTELNKIVGREHDRLFLHLDRQDVMLKNEPARQER